MCVDLGEKTTPAVLAPSAIISGPSCRPIGKQIGQGQDSQLSGTLTAPCKADSHLRVGLHAVAGNGEHLHAPGLVVLGQLHKRRLEVNDKRAVVAHEDHERGGRVGGVRGQCDAATACDVWQREVSCLPAQLHVPVLSAGSDCIKAWPWAIVSDGRWIVSEKHADEQKQLTQNACGA